MIFYFSATGNSLYAARSLDADAVSIPQVMDREETAGGLHFKSEQIGIAAPIYGHELPRMVKEFIDRAEFDTDYLYLILTYGNRHANAVELAQNVFRRAGKRVDCIRTLLMADNFLPAFDMEKQVRLDKHVEEQLADIRADLAAGRHRIEEVTEADRRAHAEYLAAVHGRPETVWADFTFTDQCLGCGICTRVCPAGCLHLERHRAVRIDDHCQACMACAHACPEGAIKVNSVFGFTEPNPHARYRNEHVSLTDLVRANRRSRTAESRMPAAAAKHDSRAKKQSALYVGNQY
ncbi:MAG: EFR1 family ferrodoxin [Anaerovoracaceae bacterium]